MSRVDIKRILADPELRRDLMIQNIVAMQAREGVTTLLEQAAEAYDKVRAEIVAKAKSGRKHCSKCDARSIPGLVNPFCQFHYDQIQWGTAWAVERLTSTMVERIPE